MVSCRVTSESNVGSDDLAEIIALPARERDGQDSAVRIETNKLRRTLLEDYATEGATALINALPKGNRNAGKGIWNGPG